MGLPDRESAYADWLDSGVAQVSAVLRATDPHARMWAWGPDQHARFWARRMLFETLLHRTDAERALGLPSGIDTALAADGVDEFLVNLPSAGFFAPGVAKLRGNGEVIAFRCADEAGHAGEQWNVRLNRDGFGLEPRTNTGADSGTRQGHARDQVTVQGGAADLLLLLYGRLSRDDASLDVSGDRKLLDHWLAYSAF